MRAHHALIALVVCAAAARATVVPVKGERKLADATYLQQQKQVMRLFLGPKQSAYHSNEFAKFDFEANRDHWTDPEVVNSFLRMYKYYDLPNNAIFTLYNEKIRWYAYSLFNLFYFAKDFDTFFKAASWAKTHMEPILFNYAYTMALYHRPDTQQFYVPPMYEVFPNYYVPQETLEEVYRSKFLGNKEGVFTYNNTGYDYNYNSNSYGGVLDYSTTNNQHLEFKISYFREDVGLNNYYLTWFRKYPKFMYDKKYGKTWFKRGEGFYYAHQQLLARYTLERLANGMPFLDLLQWDKPFPVGYDSRISHLGGQPFIPRSDDMVPNNPNNIFVKEARIMQDRIIDAISSDGYWDTKNDTHVKFTEEEGINHIGQMIYGSKDYPSRKYYGSFYFKSIEGLSKMAQYKNNFQMNAGVIACPFTSLRDPLYYNFLARLVYTMQLHKFRLPAYTKNELGFPGVVVKNMEVDKLMTYFEMFKYNLFNTVPVKDRQEYKELNYYARQFRLNHKPYNYKITVESDASYEGMVRVFIGPKYDADEHTLTLQQRRLAMFELDRFPVKIVAGQNVFERNSKESPIFAPDKQSIREMYTKLEKATQNTEPLYYYPEKVTCGFPDRFQLPRGWKNGLPFVFTVVVSPISKRYEGEEKEFYLTCGSSKLYDYRPLGFPFDRPIREDEFDVPNIFSKEFPIYHKDEVVES